MFSKFPALVFSLIVFFIGGKALYSIQNTGSNITFDQTAISFLKNEKKRKQLAKFADDFIGKKYKYAGKTPKTGFDCSGFTYFLMKSVDVKIPASSAAQSKVGQKVPLQKAQAGDLVFFKKEKNNRIFHVAMVYSNSSDGLQIIHSTSSRGVVIDDLYASKYWKPKIAFVKDVLAENQP